MIQNKLNKLVVIFKNLLNGSYNISSIQSHNGLRFYFYFYFYIRHLYYKICYFMLLGVSIM